MKQVSILGGYVHLSFGDYSSTLFPLHPENTLASFTGLVIDGELETGTVLLGAVAMNWGIALGISLTGAMYLPEEEEK